MTVVGTVIGLACLVFFAEQLHEQWSRIRHIPLDLTLIAAVAAATCIYVATYVAATATWKCCLRVLRVPISFKAAARTVLLSQFAKYLPGNVGHHIGRVYMAKQQGIGTPAVLASMMMDMALVVFAGAVCSLGALGLLVPAYQRLRQVEIPGGWYLAGALAVAVAAVFALRPVRSKLGGWASRIFVYASDARNYPPLAFALLLHVSNFVLGSLALWLICSHFGDMSPASFPALLGVYSAAWLAGFVVPGAPAGLGVREATMLVGLSAFMPPQAALAGTAVMRIVTVLGDGLAFAAGQAIRPPKRTAPYEGEPVPPTS